MRGRARVTPGSAGFPPGKVTVPPVVEGAPGPGKVGASPQSGVPPRPERVGATPQSGRVESSAGEGHCCPSTEGQCSHAAVTPGWSRCPTAPPPPERVGAVPPWWSVSGRSRCPPTAEACRRAPVFPGGEGSPRTAAGAPPPWQWVPRRRGSTLPGGGRPLPRDTHLNMLYGVTRDRRVPLVANQLTIYDSGPNATEGRRLSRAPSGR